MSSSGRTGHGRGNRRRPYRRRENDGEAWQKDAGENSRQVNGKSLLPEGKSAQGSGSHRGGGQAKGSAQEGKSSGRKQEQESSGGQSRHSGFKKKPEGRLSLYERPKWVPPKMNTDPIPVSVCPWCGKPIRDISQAIADKDSGVPVHFDCVLSRIAYGEKLEEGDLVSYIGGGRFGVICFSRAKNPQARTSEQEGARTQAARDFTIKKIIEWESKDKRAEWRSLICDHYSVT